MKYLLFNINDFVKLSEGLQTISYELRTSNP